jgi:hypothetical protein
MHCLRHSITKNGTLPASLGLGVAALVTLQSACSKERIKVSVNPPDDVVPTKTDRPTPTVKNSRIIVPATPTPSATVASSTTPTPSPVPATLFLACNKSTLRGTAGTLFKGSLTCAVTGTATGATYSMVSDTCGRAAIDPSSGVVAPFLLPTTDCSFTVRATAGSVTADAIVQARPESRIVHASSGMPNYTGVPSVHLESGVFEPTGRFWTSGWVSGISMTADFGLNWKTATRSVDGLTSVSRSVLFLDGEKVYGSTSEGLNVSSDSGLTWSRLTMLNSALPSNDVRATAAKGTTVLVGTASGIGVSQNGGVAFAAETTAQSLPTNNIADVAMELDGDMAPSHYYAATASGLALRAVGQTSWTVKTTDNGLGSNNVRKVFVDGNTIYAATAVGLAISTDHGATWTNRTVANSSLANNSIHSVAASGTLVAVRANNSMSLSTNGGTSFTTVTFGSYNTAGVVVRGSNIAVFLSGAFPATAGGIAFSQNGGSTWTTRTAQDTPEDGWIYFTRAFGADLYAGARIGLLKSSDAGRTWTLLSGIPKWSYIGIFDREGSKLVGGSNAGLYVSTDAGVSFTQRTVANSGLPTNSLNNSSFSLSLAAGKIYLGTTSGLSISSNDGASWTTLTTAQGLPSNTVNRVLVEGQSIYAGTPAGLAMSTDGGASWTTKTVSDGLPSLNVKGVVRSGTTLVASTAAGLSLSSDGGNTWGAPASEGMLAGRPTGDLVARDGAVFVQVELVGSLSGLGVSIDGGSSWQLIGNEKLHGATFSTVSVGDDGLLALGSTNGGIGVIFPTAP